MGELLDDAPIAAAFAIPQFLPQILKLRATDDTAGVSWSWARPSPGAAGGTDRRLGVAPRPGIHHRRPRGPGIAAHVGLHPPSHAVDLDRLPDRSTDGNLTRNLDAHLR
jgi:hypothetical protein